MKKIFSIALIAAIVATSAVMLSACKGGHKNATTATAATTATTAATTATTAPTAAATQAAQSGSNTGSDANTANQNSDSSVTYGGITQDKAYSLAVESAGQGAQVISAYQGSIPSGSQAGSEAWVVTVQLPDGTQRSYYCGYPFCFSIEDGAYDSQTIVENGEYAGITEEKANSLALETAGEGAQVTGCMQGTVPSGSMAGSEAWVLTVQLSDGTVKTFYAGFPFIFDADTLQ